MGRHRVTGNAELSDEGIDDVERRYRSHADSTEWLLGELVEFYDGDGDRVDDLLDNLESRSEHLASTVIGEGDLIAFDVRVLHDDHVSTISMSELPHPIELLWVLCPHARHGDIVQITHHHLHRTHGVTLRWPFGIDDAIVATSPDLQAASSAADYPSFDSTRSRLGVPAPVATFAAATLGVAVAAASYTLGRRRNR